MSYLSDVPHPPQWVHVRSWPALGLGAFFAAVTVRVLLDDVASGGAFTINHIASIAALVAALGAGHYAWPALRRGAIVPGLILGVVFLASSVYIIVQSGARNAERAGDKAATIEEVNRQRASITKMRAEADYLLATCPAGTPKAAHGVSCGLREAMLAECGSGKGKRCDGRAYSVRTYEAAIAGYDAKLAALGPAKAPAAGYAHAARVLDAMGVPGGVKAIQDRVELIMPFLSVLIGEAATIAFAHLGLGHRPAPAQQRASAPVAEASKPETSKPEPSRPEPPKGGRKSRRGATRRDPKVVTFVQEYRARHGRDPSTRDVQARFAGMPKSTPHRYATDHGTLASRPMLRVA